MRQRVHHLIVIIEQLHLDFHRVFRKRHEEHVLEGFLRMLGLVGGQPFLEEGREGVTVDDDAVFLRTDGNLTVAS